MEKKLYVKDLIEEFELEVLSNKESINREIKAYGINRAGLELTGYFEKSSKSKRLILMSTKENNYIMKFSKDERQKKYDMLLKYNTPCIIITSKFKDKDILLEVSKKHDVPIIFTNDSSTSDLTQLILEYMDEYFAPTVEVHGTLVNIYGKGVLITGESGIGKSEVSIELVGKNHLFVGDDRIVISRRFGYLQGKCHPILKNLVEVRGLGIVDITKIMGYKAVIESTSVDLVVELDKFMAQGIDDTERLGDNFESKEFIGVKIPFIKIPVSFGRNVSLIIENAVGKLKLMNEADYINPIKLISDRIDKENKK